MCLISFHAVAIFSSVFTVDSPGPPVSIPHHPHTLNPQHNHFISFLKLQKISELGRWAGLEKRGAASLCLPGFQYFACLLWELWEAHLHSPCPPLTSLDPVCDGKTWPSIWKSLHGFSKVQKGLDQRLTCPSLEIIGYSRYHPSSQLVFGWKPTSWMPQLLGPGHLVSGGHYFKEWNNEIFFAFCVSASCHIHIIAMRLMTLVILAKLYDF